MISLHKLEIFALVVEAGSFSGAAERLYMTQSAVSQHVQGLEAGLGTKLFKRGHRGVMLTAQGEILWDYTQTILRLLAEAESAVTDVERLTAGQIRIGATPGVGMYLVPDWSRVFRNRYPQLSVSLVTGVTHEIVDGILQHALDIGFVEGDFEDHPRLEQVILQEVEQFVVVGKGHPWCHEPDVSITALTGQPFIVRPRGSHSRVWLDSILAQHHVTLNVIAEFDNPEAIKQAVMSGAGITVFPEYAIRREQAQNLMRAVTVSDVAFRRTLKAIWHRDEPLSAIVRAFLSELVSSFPGLAALLEPHS